jgi:hypothetical protein
MTSDAGPRDLLARQSGLRLSRQALSRAVLDWKIAVLGDLGLFHLFWNWIGRSQEEIVQARLDWMEGARFGTVKGYDGAPLPAPELPPVPLKPRGRVR